MPIPSQKELQIPLLHLINFLGGRSNRSKCSRLLADYFHLTEKERLELQPSGHNRKFDNRVDWARNSLCDMGFLDRSQPGVWIITIKGRKELVRSGLIEKPFSTRISLLKQGPSPITRKSKEKETEVEVSQELILEEIVPHGPKKFPDDFLDKKKCSDCYEIKLPGTQLSLSPLSKTIIISQKGYFRYEAKNPSEAKYILYAHKVGDKKLKIPADNLTLFKTVKTYENYCNELNYRAFKFFLEFSHDEEKAEDLAREVTRRLGLRGKLFNSYKHP